MENLFELALKWQAENGAAMATVVETWGSAPRRAGAQMLVSKSGAMQGSVSGGCVEGAVVLEAMEAVETGQPRLLEYGVADDQAFAAGLACGGTIRILVEPVVQRIVNFEQAALMQSNGDAFALETDLSNWDQRFAGDGQHADLYAADRSTVVDGQFVQVFNKPLRMVIVGAVHIAQPLVTLAQMAGYRPIIVDPREAFGNADRFPGVQIHNDWPDAVLSDLGLDRRTAIVTLAHDPKIDDAALSVALKSDAFYIGSLGSKRTHAKRVDRLKEAGFTEGEILRIHGPVGLPIKSSNPVEIAISIMAEVTQQLRSA
ncbi:MAG: XdhC family protein [Paracoccaceae bacterium]|nr:XdhC family protein [Paracoccaceae bacterium]